MTARNLRAEVIKPLPAQARFLDAMWAKKYILFGGAAGPGKSHILRWSLVEFHLYWAKQGVRNIRSGLFCENYPVLKDRQIAQIKREFPSWLGTLRSRRDEGYGFFFHPAYGGGQIALRNLDDPAKYASTEFAAIAVDELTKNRRSTFDDLRFRLRWPGIEHSPFLAASNPGSVGHGWVKKLWVDRDFGGDDSVLDPSDFLFIPARAGENPYNPDSYMSTLDSLPEAMRRAMRDGSWDAFEGQVFMEWRRDLHVCPPFAIPASWTRWLAIDYGYASPYCCLWFARSPDKSRIYVYREDYQKGLRAAAHAKRVIALSGGEHLQHHMADPSLWQQREGAAGDSLAGEYAYAGFGPLAGQQRPPDRSRLRPRGAPLARAARHPAAHQASPSAGLQQLPQPDPHTAHAALRRPPRGGRRYQRRGPRLRRPPLRPRPGAPAAVKAHGAAHDLGQVIRSNP